MDLFQVLMATRLLNTAKRKAEKERLSTLHQLEKASRTLAVEIDPGEGRVSILTDGPVEEGQVRAAAEAAGCAVAAS
ncbi:heavy-metal-associated domain-containing protein [Nonomuraea sp. B5E05]|uniref:heavy-metal-associated domain-containing protein n=1 Tax=Nonomuraea sp. B5E05 TaxID=3153569 RepID=UPI0032611212